MYSCGPPEQAKAGQPARTYIQQLCANTGCSLKDLLEAMDTREGWWERVMEIRADGATRWWWWYTTKKTFHKLDKLFIRIVILKEILLWILTQTNTSVSWLLDLCDTGCCLEDMPRATDDRDGWWKSKESSLSGQHDDKIKNSIFLLKTG